MHNLIHDLSPALMIFIALCLWYSSLPLSRVSAEAHHSACDVVQEEAKARNQKDQELGKTSAASDDAMPADAPRALAAFYQKGRT